MKYNNLGKSGLKISKVVLGAMGYGDPKYVPWMLPEEKALPLLEHAFKRGINTWDTADFYCQGRSEEIIGAALKKYKIPRARLVILTKCFFGIDEAIFKDGVIDVPMSMINDGHMVNRVGLSRKHILDAVDASVARLGTYIDVLQIHRLDRDTPPEEIMRALNDVIESGKVRYIGASSMAAWEFQMLNNVAEKHGWHKFISMQNYHNMLYREEEREMHPYCQHAGIGLIPWSPLAGGVLARPWRNSEESVRSKAEQFRELVVSAGDYVVVDRLEEVSKRLGVSMAKVAIAWSIRKGVNPIVGLQSIERIDEAVDAAGLELSDEDFTSLDEVYKAKPVAPIF
ncbi:voltage-gated shaker-like K+ channel, subunit [Lojkania enalia]|uniref:Voltage-gated shaker-like K+ channel, subunit n=1 Tax=Lojkania enalia TaxID=147567 RepID=A0A9P4N7M8_9PLEO|nr:voltage-gated shaker-like K+ channel, subunit [Didymosphaeria enalia]